MFMFMLTFFCLRFTQTVTAMQMESNPEVTEKHAVEYSKTVCLGMNKSVCDVQVLIAHATI